MSALKGHVLIVFLFRLLCLKERVAQSVRLMDPDIDVGAVAQTKIGPNLGKVEFVNVNSRITNNM